MALPILKKLHGLLGRSTPELMLAQAHRYLQEQEFDKAIGLLQRILKADSFNSSALNLFGFALGQTGKASEALSNIRQAISINPNGRGYYTNLGSTLHRLGDLVGAEQAYRQEISLTPSYGLAYLQLSELLSQKGEFEESLEICRTAIKASDDADDAYIRLAAHELLIERNAIACLEILDPLLLRKPEHLDARLIAARAHLSASNFDQSENLLRGLVREDPDNAEYLAGLGQLKLLTGQGTDAEACFRRVLALAPDHVQAARFLTSLLLETGKLDDAGDLLEVFATQYPEDEGFCRCSGRRAMLLGSLDESLKHYHRALEINPEDVASIEQIANLKMRQGLLEEALETIRKALALNPQRQMTRYNYSFALLMSGHFREGLAEFESRMKIPYEEGTPFELRASIFATMLHMKDIPAWDGQSLNGKKLLIWREQGYGDSIMMMRFFHDVRKLEPGKIGVLAVPELLSLIESMDVVDEVIPIPAWNKHVHAPEYDYQCSVMSLPYLLKSELGTLANNVPYLRAQGDRISYWKQFLRQAASAKRLNIGIVWAGNPQLLSDKARSISLAQLAPMITTVDANWISLQKGPSQTQIREQELPVLDAMENISDFTDTAALIEALDLVIAVDTAIVHLAGALGKPVWMLNRSTSEWRWMWRRQDSPWYPSLHIFNQHNGETWESVIARVTAELKALVATG